MGQFDKDRFQKELAIRYCLARGMVPFPEVLVPSAADLTDSAEVLTDIDVLGLEAVSDGALHRTMFDCKTASRLSAVNRAFWAAGVAGYTKCNHAFVILKNRAVHNHRMSALAMGVDLHTEQSFSDLGASVSTDYPAETAYQSSIGRWQQLQGAYDANPWARELHHLNRNVVPLSTAAPAVFRRYLAELRALRGRFDPAKPQHVAIYLEAISAILVLWVSMSRDARRFYEPTISMGEFERTLRYYLWGGRESYEIRQQLRDRSIPDGGQASAVELPAWGRLVSFVGIVIAAPQGIFDCILYCRELAIRQVSQREARFDERLVALCQSNSRVKQFSVALSDYLVAACGVPKDLGRRAAAELLGE